MQERSLPALNEVITGRMRPRHYRFSRALERLLGPERLEVIGRPPSRRIGDIFV